jgi:hypothetical protein
MKYFTIALLAWGMFSTCHAGEAVTQVWEHVIQVGPGLEDPGFSYADIHGDGDGGVVLYVGAKVSGTGSSARFLLWLDEYGQELWRSPLSDSYLVQDVRPNSLLYRWGTTADLNTYYAAILTSTGVVANVSTLPAPPINAIDLLRHPATLYDHRGFFKPSDSGGIIRYNYIDQPPVIIAPSTFGTDGSNYIVTWTSITGRRYKVQSTPDLVTPVWTDRSAFLSGTGSPMSYAQPVTPGPVYFRVAQE